MFDPLHSSNRTVFQKYHNPLKELTDRNHRKVKNKLSLFFEIFLRHEHVLIYQIHKIHSYSNENSELNSLVRQLQKVPSVKVWQLVLESIFEFNSSVLEKLFFNNTYRTDYFNEKDSTVEILRNGKFLHFLPKLANTLDNILRMYLQCVIDNYTL